MLEEKLIYRPSISVFLSKNILNWIIINYSYINIQYCFVLGKFFFSRVKHFEEEKYIDSLFREDCLEFWLATSSSCVNTDTHSLILTYLYHFSSIFIPNFFSSEIFHQKIAAWRWNFVLLQAIIYFKWLQLFNTWTKIWLRFFYDAVVVRIKYLGASSRLVDVFCCRFLKRKYTSF